MVLEGQLDKDTGQIPGSGFDGDVHDHLHGRSFTEKVPYTSFDGTLSMTNSEGLGGNSALYQEGTSPSILHPLAVSKTCS